MPVEARVECLPEFRSAALSSARAACGMACLALRPSGSAQAIEIKDILDDLRLSDRRFAAIVEWANSRLKMAKVAEKDTQAFENMGSPTKWRPKKLALWRKTPPNLALCRARLVAPSRKPAHVDSTAMQRPLACRRRRAAAIRARPKTALRSERLC